VDGFRSLGVPDRLRHHSSLIGSYDGRDVVMYF
jgi:hypothetical protein